MVGNGVPKSKAASWPFTNPWPPLGVGLALLGLGMGLSVFGLERLTFPVVVLGLLLVGAAISLRLSFAAWELEDRAVSAGIVALGALAALMGYYTFATSYDSLAMALGVAVGLGLAGALLILLPPLARRLTITVLVLVHFSAIIDTIVGVAPPQGQAPYLVIVANTYFYRYYLQFAYLPNAYHFYSPDPGPPSLLWFAVEYEKGHPRWLMMPDREASRTRQDYQRYLALGEYTSQPSPVQPAPAILDQLWQARVVAGQNLHIPPVPEEIAPRNRQFMVPNTYSRHVVASYARHVAVSYPSDYTKDTGNEDHVVSVKVYRVLHNILSPSEMAHGRDPMGRDTYVPFFLGKFDATGKALSQLSEFDAQGKLTKTGDPFLYWVIPMDWVVRPELLVGGMPPPMLQPDPKTHLVRDTSDTHAGFTKEQSEKYYGPSALPAGQPVEAPNR